MDADVTSAATVQLARENAMLRAALAAAERERDEAREALRNALIHTAHLPLAGGELLEGLLASINRICKAALATPAPQTSSKGGTDETG